MATSSNALVERDLQNCVTHLNNLMKILNTVTPNRKEIQKEVKCLMTILKRAEEEMEDNISDLTSKCLDEEAALSSAQSQLRSMKAKDKDLKRKLEQNQRSLKRQREMLKEAEDDVSSKKKIVNRKNEEYSRSVKHQENTQIATAVLGLVPFVNLVTTPILLTVALTVLKSAVDDAESDLKDSEQSLSQARRDCNKEKETCNEMEAEIQRVTHQISHQKRQIRSCKNNIERLRAEKNEENRKLQQLRNLMKYISKLSGRAEIMQQESLRFYDIATLYMPLKSIVDLLSDFTSGISVHSSYFSFWNRVLSGPGFKTIAMNDDWL